MKPKLGDKVRIKTGHSAGERALVSLVELPALVVRLNSGAELRVHEAEVTNFSLAARKAWQKMPDRAVGRPAGARHCDRLSVTLRIDRALWERFRTLERSGQIRNRTEFINRFLRDALSKLA